jgi:hypothetical protein
MTILLGMKEVLGMFDLVSGHGRDTKGLPEILVPL